MSVCCEELETVYIRRSLGIIIIINGIHKQEQHLARAHSHIEIVAAGRIGRATYYADLGNVAHIKPDRGGFGRQ